MSLVKYRFLFSKTDAATEDLSDRPSDRRPF